MGLARVAVGLDFRERLGNAVSAKRDKHTSKAAINLWTHHLTSNESSRNARDWQECCENVKITLQY